MPQPPPPPWPHCWTVREGTPERPLPYVRGPFTDMDSLKEPFTDYPPPGLPRRTRCGIRCVQCTQRHTGAANEPSTSTREPNETTLPSPAHFPNPRPTHPTIGAPTPPPHPDTKPSCGLRVVVKASFPP
ncbi:hypothetical protein GCM10027360_11850 [Amycolatopsis echigonensis]